MQRYNFSMREGGMIETTEYDNTFVRWEDVEDRIAALEAELAKEKEKSTKLNAEWITQRSALNAIAHTTYDNVAFAQRTAQDALAIGVPAAAIRAIEASNDAVVRELAKEREKSRLVWFKSKNGVWTAWKAVVGTNPDSSPVCYRVTDKAPFIAFAPKLKMTIHDSEDAAKQWCEEHYRANPIARAAVEGGGV